mgnify:CR=1 FL=1
MAMTMTQKILAKHAGLDHVEVGQLIEAKVDMVLGNDITTPVAITEFEKAGFTQVFDKDKISIVLDHYTPCKDIKSAELCLQARNFAHKHEITNFFDVGQMGIEHALLHGLGVEVLHAEADLLQPRVTQRPRHVLCQQVARGIHALVRLGEKLACAVEERD